ncbi:unnamed protein product [Schistocephalus solidus]|uniref:Peptidase A2 domain-containing protein n=1 Tax=Schistocephalus solidus TaxID=70667 RepID=A0A183SDP5_SCHSO|nr:unnamed protein product [Schistocephalus solidus]
MAERLMKTPGAAKPQPAALSTSPVPPVTPLSHLKAELVQPAEQVASLQEPTASLNRSPPISTARPVQSSSSRPTSTATCWYHSTFSAKALRCISPCSFIFQQSKRVKRVIPRVNATNITEVSSPSRTFYVCDSERGKRFLVDTGAQLSVLPPTKQSVPCDFQHSE